MSISQRTFRGHYVLFLHIISSHSYLQEVLTSSREQRNLLTASNRVHDINGGNASLDHLLGVGALRGVDGGSRDVEEGLGQDWGTACVRMRVSGNDSPCGQTQGNMYAFLIACSHA